MASHEQRSNSKKNYIIIKKGGKEYAVFAAAGKNYKQRFIVPILDTIATCRLEPAVSLHQNI